MDLSNIESQMWQEAFNLPDWTYHDLPKLSLADFDRFIEIAGESNLKWITIAEYRNGDTFSKRGQVMISPKGMENCRNYTKNLK